MKQTDLWEEPEPNPAHALARRENPETSKQAARAIAPSLGTLQARVLALVKAAPGSTGSELAHGAGDGDPRHVNRRLGELAAAGEIRRGEARACKRTGRSATTWWPS